MIIYINLWHLWHLRSCCLTAKHLQNLFVKLIQKISLHNNCPMLGIWGIQNIFSRGKMEQSHSSLIRTFFNIQILSANASHFAVSLCEQLCLIFLCSNFFYICKFATCFPSCFPSLFFSIEHSVKKPSCTTEYQCRNK
jgi:hypothetical protein